MEVPEFWAEARKRHRDKERQVTVRRFGWSNRDLAEAQSMAEARATEALERILAGDKLNRREPKVAYNGADGVPIREEVLRRLGQLVITRNSYGAHCLNTPDALFADIDFASGPGCGTLMVASLLLLVLSVASCAVVGLLPILIYACVILCMLLYYDRVWKAWIKLRGGHQAIARGRIDRFLDRHSDWNLRLYETPAGLRLMATHKTFDPTSAQVQEFFSAVRVDSCYQRMCVRQRCFRARLTAKPWRIGIAAHMRPRPGVWPVAPERKAARDAWIQTYEQTAQSYAACRFIMALGSGQTDPQLRDVIELHDQLSQALRPQLPIA